MNLFRPWEVAPLKGKYYGTRIVDWQGKEVLKVWISGEHPSERETDEEIWDGHFESEESLFVARTIVNAINEVTK